MTSSDDAAMLVWPVRPQAHPTPEDRIAALDEETRNLYRTASSIPPLPGQAGAAENAPVPGLTPEAPVAAGVRVEDVAVSGAGGDVWTRIYTPEAVAAPHAVMVHIHGGGWVVGGGLSAYDGEDSARALALGCVVVHPDFGLAPDNKFPRPVDECFAVLRWVADQADERGWDAERIGVMGGCTGGNMAAVCTLMARDAGYPKVAVQHLRSVILDLRCDTRSHHEFASGFGLSRATNFFVIGQYLNDPEERWDWRASPLLAPSMRGLPPTVIAQGEFDILRDEARQYADRLRDAGVDVTYIEPVGQPHGFTQSATTSAANVEAEVYALLRRYLGTD